MTTSLSDAQSIDNLLSDSSYDSMQFNAADWGYISDINNGAYADRINFSTTVLKQQLVDYNSAFITIPLQVSRAQLTASDGTYGGGFQAGITPTNPKAPGPSGAVSLPYPVVSSADYVTTQTASGISTTNAGYHGSYLKGNTYNEPLLAFRDSILSLICGLIVQTDNGQMIVNELGRVDMMNNLRLKIENSIDWMQTMGSLLHFSLDSAANSYYNGSSLPYVNGSTGEIFQNNLVNPFLPSAEISQGIYSTWPAPVPASTAPAGLALPGSAQGQPRLYGLTNGTIAITTGGALTVTGGTWNSSFVGGTVTTAGGLTFTITTVPTAVTATVLPLPGTAVATTTYSVNYGMSGMAVPNPGYNQGLANRIQFFQQASTYMQGLNTGTAVSGCYNLVVKIPLRMLHDFFEQLDFPIINVGFNLQLVLRQQNNSSGLQAPAAPTCYDGISPLQSGAVFGPNLAANALANPYALWTSACPAIQYGAGNGNDYGSTARLYYRSIKLNPAENEAFRTKLMRGFTKSIKFISTDMGFSPPGALTSIQNSYVISPSIVWPLRVWAMLYTNGTTNNNTTRFTGGALAGNWISGPSGGGTAANYSQAAQCGLQVTHGWMKNAQISVNNQPYFKVPLNTPDDFWLQFKDQLNRNTGCMIAYSDFITKFRYHVFDISRLSDRLPSKTEAVSLVLSFDRADTTAGPCDLVVMVERMNQVTMDFSASDVNITVGNITG